MSYRLLTYAAGKEPRAGVLVGDAVYDVAAATRKRDWSSVMTLLAEWPAAKMKLTQLAKRPGRGGIPLKRTKLMAPVLYPGNIYCAGASYTDHMAEMARAQGKEPGPTMKDLGEKPWHGKSSWSRSSAARRRTCRSRRRSASSPATPSPTIYPRAT